MEKEHRNKLFDFFNAVSWVVLSALFCCSSNPSHFEIIRCFIRQSSNQTFKIFVLFDIESHCFIST